MVHRFPERFRGIVEEYTAIQQSVGMRRSGTRGYWRSFFTRRGMSERCKGTVFWLPILGCPAIVVEITDTSLTCGDPVITRKYSIKDVIHVLIDGDIGVEEDAGVIGD